jgi:hypothetical protein
LNALGLRESLRHSRVNNHVLHESAVLNDSSRTLKCLILDCHVETVYAKIIGEVNTVLELLLNHMSPLLSLESLWVVKPVELNGPEDEWTSRSIVESLLEVLKFIQVELPLGRGTLRLVILLLLVISCVLLSALTRLLLGSRCDGGLPSFFFVLDNFLSRFSY